MCIPPTRIRLIPAAPCAGIPRHLCMRLFIHSLPHPHPRTSGETSSASAAPSTSAPISPQLAHRHSSLPYPLKSLCQPTFFLDQTPSPPALSSRKVRTRSTSSCSHHQCVLHHPNSIMCPYSHLYAQNCALCALFSSPRHFPAFLCFRLPYPIPSRRRPQTGPSSTLQLEILAHQDSPFRQSRATRAPPWSTSQLPTSPSFVVVCVLGSG
jgi:hypothetical protein